MGDPVRIVRVSVEDYLAGERDSETRHEYVDGGNDPVDEPDAYVETRPTPIVEILSPSTAAIDRREKRVAYLATGTLQEYVLIAQDRAEVVVHRREGDGWLLETFGGGERVELGSIGFALDVDELYRDVL